MGVFLNNTNKTAVIVKGNSNIINSIEWKDIATSYYNDIKVYLESKAYEVSYDPGKGYTRPKKADLWIGHSKGVDRLQYAYKSTKTLAFGELDGINHPKDTSLKKGDPPVKEHFMFSIEQKEAIDKIDVIINKEKSLK